MSTPSTTQPEPTEITRQRLTAEDRTRLEQMRDACQAALDGRPWQYRYSEQAKWKDNYPGQHPPDYPHTRPKPWTLGRTVNGFTLPEGREWHRQDFTEEDLSGGWRPLMLGEEPRKGDEYLTLVSVWTSLLGNGGGESERSHLRTRTRRPIPSAPEVRAWSKPEDVPGPVCYIEGHGVNNAGNDTTFPMLVGCVYEDGVTVTQRDSVMHMSWADLRKRRYSLDRKTWLPCGVEVGK